MHWIYKEDGVKTDKECPECSQKMILFEEMGLKYLVCSNDNCRYLGTDLDEENILDTDSQLIKNWFKVGLFNLEGLARENSTGYVSKAVWLHIMNLEAKSHDFEIDDDLLENIWNSQLSKILLREVQQEKAKNNLN
jgi:ssDNA-binding Zn-finger/Zn-ribbon topoisomerase 1